MSRITYNEDDNWAAVRWGGAAKRALQGKPGQAVLHELEEALLAMPTKRLIVNKWSYGGDVCVLGALDVYRRTKTGISWGSARHDIHPGTIKRENRWDGYDDDDWEYGSEWARERLNITHTLAWEIIEKNDEVFKYQSPEARYERMLKWVQSCFNEQPLT